MSQPKNLLALDTTFAACSVALSLDEGCGAASRRHWRHEEMATGHAERLMPMIDDVMAEATVGFSELDAIAVTVGPGSFTGTRVGIAAARGLALAAGLPIYGASSLALIAEAAFKKIDQFDEAADVLMVCVDARRDQIYYQEFNGPGKRPLSEARLCAAEDAALNPPTARRVVAVGSAANEVVRISDTGAGCRIERGPAVTLPSAVHFADAYLEEMTPLRPLYLRPADAKPQVGKSIARAPS